MKICPSCGSRYEGNERFCPNDGEELAVFSEDQPGSWSGKTVGGLELDSLLEDEPYGELYRVKGDSGTTVKLIRPTVGTHRAQSGNFEADLEAAAGIDHPDVARCRGFDLETEPRHVVWEHLDGAVPLSDLVREGGPMPERAAFLLTLRIASALTALHDERVFHRNLHPGAILLGGINHQTLRKDADAILTVPAKIRFWAEAHLVRVKDPIAAHQKNPKGFYGRAEYLAPEQAQGRAADERTDIYALGVVLYEALTGKAPFTSGSFTTTLKRQIYEKPLLPRIARPGLKLERQAEDLVVRMLSKRPEERFESTAALTAAFGECGFALPERAAPTPGRAPTEESKNTRALSRAEIREMLAQDSADEDTSSEAMAAAMTASGAATVVDPSPSDDAQQPPEEAEATPAEHTAATDPAPTQASTPDTTETQAEPANAVETDEAPQSAADAQPEAAEETSDSTEVETAASTDKADATGAPEAPAQEVASARDANDGPELADAPPKADLEEGEAKASADDAKGETGADAKGEDGAASSEAPPAKSSGRKRKRGKKKRGKQRSGSTKTVPMAASPDIKPPAKEKSKPASKPSSAPAVTELRGRTDRSTLSAPISGETTLKKTRTIKNGRNGVSNGNGVSHAAMDAADLDLGGDDWFAGEGDAPIEAAPVEDDSGFAGKYNVVFAVLLVLLVAAGVGGFWVMTQSANQQEDRNRNERAAAHAKKLEEGRKQLVSDFDSALAAGKTLPPASGNAFALLRQMKLSAGIGGTDAYRQRETSFLGAATKEMQAALGAGNNDRAAGIAQLILGMKPEHAEAKRILALAKEPPPAAVADVADVGGEDAALAAAPDAAFADAEALAGDNPDAAPVAIAAIDDKAPSAEELAEAKRKEEEAARLAAEEEARKKAAEEEARKQAEEDAKKKAEEDARKAAADEEARRKAEEEARKKAEADAKAAALADAARKKEAAAAQKKADADAKKAAREEAKRKADAEKARKREEAAARKAEAAKKRDAERERKAANADAKAKARAAKREEAKRLMKVASGQSGAAALATYRKVVAIDPSNHRAHFNIGVKLSESGDFNGALRHLERAVKLRGRSSHYRLRLANAYFKTGNKAKAKAQYQKVLELDPENRAAKAMIKRF